MQDTIPDVFQSAPWFLPGTTDQIAIAEQALTWLSENPTFARKFAPRFVPVLFENPGPERMTDWLINQRQHNLEYRARRAAFLALQPGDPVFCSCQWCDIPLSSCACQAEGHPAFRQAQ